MKILWISLGLAACLMADVPKVEPETGLPLVYHEDFEKGRNAWELSDEKCWKHREENGNHVLSIVERKSSSFKPKYRSPFHIALLKDVEVADFVLMYKVKGPMPENSNHRDSCAFFNYQNPNQFYYVHTGLKPDRNSGQIMIVDNAARTPITNNKNLAPWKVDVWHQVKVVRDSKSGSIKIYFDDMKNPYMVSNDKSFGKGRVGIGSFDDINDFDDIRVYGR